MASRWLYMISFALLMLVWSFAGSARAGDAEKQMAAECLVTASGTAAAYAGCVLKKMAWAEASKCLNGSSECFGNGNDLRKFQNWVQSGLGPKMRAKRYQQLHFINFTNQTVSYRMETDTADGNSSLPPGYWESQSGEGYEGWWNIYAEGQSTSFDNGALVAFEMGGNGQLVINDITPHSVAVKNDCRYPVTVWLYYRTFPQDWVVKGAWTVNGSSRTLLNAEADLLLITNNSLLYYYATSNSLVWEGRDITIPIYKNGNRVSVGMRQATPSRAGDGAYELGLSCP